MLVSAASLLLLMGSCAAWLASAMIHRPGKLAQQYSQHKFFALARRCFAITVAAWLSMVLSIVLILRRSRLLYL